MPRRLNDRSVYLQAMSVAERQLLEWAFKQANGHPIKTAELLQISAPALYVRCHKSGIVTPAQWRRENEAKLRAAMGFQASEAEYGFHVAPIDEINELEQ